MTRDEDSGAFAAPHRPWRHSLIIFVPILVPIASRAHLPATAVIHTYRAHPWALFALFTLRRGTRARVTGQVGAEAEHVVHSRVAPLVPVCGVSHQPDSSTFRLERGRELMTRRADTDMTCSRGKAGTVGYATWLVAFCRIYSSTPLFAQLSRPTVTASLLTLGRDPNGKAEI